MAVLNLSASEPYVATPASGDGSALFPAAPVYARTPARKTSGKSNLPLLIGAPVAAVAVAALAWGMMSQRAETPTTDSAQSMQVAEAAPTPLPEATPPAAMPQPTPAAAAPAPTPAPTQVARAEPRPAPVRRAAPARRAAPEAAPDAASASANVSASVPAPVAAPPAAPVVIAAPGAAAPAPTPAPAPAAPVTPAPAEAPM